MTSVDNTFCLFRRSDDTQDPLSKLPTEISNAFAQFTLNTITVDLQNAARPAKITMENSQNNKTFSLTLCSDSDGGWHATTDYVRWDFVESNGIAIVVMLNDENKLMFDKQSAWTSVANGLTDILNLNPECRDFLQIAVPYWHAVWMWQTRQFVQNKILSPNADSRNWRKLRQSLTKVCRFLE